VVYVYLICVRFSTHTTVLQFTTLPRILTRFVLPHWFVGSHHTHYATASPRLTPRHFLRLRVLCVRSQFTYSSFSYMPYLLPHGYLSHTTYLDGFHLAGLWFGCFFFCVRLPLRLGPRWFSFHTLVLHSHTLRSRFHVYTYVLFLVHVFSLHFGLRFTRFLSLFRWFGSRLLFSHLLPTTLPFTCSPYGYRITFTTRLPPRSLYGSFHGSRFVGSFWFCTALSRGLRSPHGYAVPGWLGRFWVHMLGYTVQFTSLRLHCHLTTRFTHLGSGCLLRFTLVPGWFMVWFTCTHSFLVHFALSFVCVFFFSVFGSSALRLPLLRISRSLVFVTHWFANLVRLSRLSLIHTRGSFSGYSTPFSFRGSYLPGSSLVHGSFTHTRTVRFCGYRSYHRHIPATFRISRFAWCLLVPHTPHSLHNVHSRVALHIRVIALHTVPYLALVLSRTRNGLRFAVWLHCTRTRSQVKNNGCHHTRSSFSRTYTIVLS